MKTKGDIYVESEIYSPTELTTFRHLANFLYAYVSSVHTYSMRAVSLKASLRKWRST